MCVFVGVFVGWVRVWVWVLFVFVFVFVLFCLTHLAVLFVCLFLFYNMFYTVVELLFIINGLQFTSIIYGHDDYERLWLKLWALGDCKQEGAHF